MRIILAFTGYFGGFGSSLRGKMRRDGKITSCPTALAAIMLARFIDCITVGSGRNLGVGRRPPHRFPPERNGGTEFFVDPNTIPRAAIENTGWSMMRPNWRPSRQSVRPSLTAATRRPRRDEPIAEVTLSLVIQALRSATV